MTKKRHKKSNDRKLGTGDEEQPISNGPKEASTLENETEIYRVKKDDGEDILLSKSLTKNTYSIIYVADPKSWAFIYGIIFYVIQICLLSFALIGQFGRSSAYDCGRLLSCFLPNNSLAIILPQQRCRIRQLLPGTGGRFHMGPNIRISRSTIVCSTVWRSLGYCRACS